ncbi:MAG: hypothetical protein AB7L84_11350 [Acidimicrobiia bacterium]
MTRLAHLDEDDRIAFGHLRALVGSDVALDTSAEHLEGRLLSCTHRSAWLVCGDEDRVIALPEVQSVHAR